MSPLRPQGCTGLDSSCLGDLWWMGELPCILSQSSILSYKAYFMVIVSGILSFCPGKASHALELVIFALEPELHRAGSVVGWLGNT